MKHITFHGLRQTCATLALKIGVPVKVVSERRWDTRGFGDDDLPNGCALIFVKSGQVRTFVQQVAKVRRGRLVILDGGPHFPSSGRGRADAFV